MNFHRIAIEMPQGGYLYLNIPPPKAAERDIKDGTLWLKPLNNEELNPMLDILQTAFNTKKE